MKRLYGLAVTISYLPHIENIWKNMFKKCVQNKQSLLFSLLIINKYYTPKMLLPIV